MARHKGVRKIKQINSVVQKTVVKLFKGSSFSGARPTRPVRPLPLHPDRTHLGAGARNNGTGTMGEVMKRHAWGPAISFVARSGVRRRTETTPIVEPPMSERTSWNTCAFS